MGADLYIESLHKAAKEKYEPLFDEAVQLRNAATREETKQKYQEEVEKYFDLLHGDGYFRDPYNIWNLSSTLGFSWWNDIVPQLDEENFLSVEKVKEFLAKIESVEQKLPTAEKLTQEGFTLKPGDLEEIQQGFKDHRQQLIDFLKRAIKLNEPIRCSL